MEVPMLGQPKGEPVTTEHEIFVEIADALKELILRTEILAQRLAILATGHSAIVSALIEAGIVNVDSDDAESDAGQNTEA